MGLNIFSGVDLDRVGVFRFCFRRVGAGIREISLRCGRIGA